MTNETIKYEMSSDKATERDLQVLDAVIGCGVNLTTDKIGTWLLVAEKVQDEVLHPEIKLHLREFVERTMLYANKESVVQDHQPPTLKVVYVPGRQIALSYATTHAKFDISFDFAAINFDFVAGRARF